jgi:hypothetical protein
MIKSRLRFGVEGFVSVKKTVVGFGWFSWKVTVKEPFHLTLIAVDVDTAVNATLAATLLPLNGMLVLNGDATGNIFATVTEVES